MNTNENESRMIVPLIVINHIVITDVAQVSSGDETSEPQGAERTQGGNLYSSHLLGASRRFLTWQMDIDDSLRKRKGKKAQTDEPGSQGLLVHFNSRRLLRYV